MEAESLVETSELVACTLTQTHTMHVLWRDCKFALISRVRQVQMNFLVHASGSRTHWTNIREAPYEALSVLTSLKAGPTPSRPVRESVRVWASKRRRTSGFNVRCCFPVKAGESFEAKVLLWGHGAGRPGEELDRLTPTDGPSSLQLAGVFNFVCSLKVAKW